MNAPGYTPAPMPDKIEYSMWKKRLLIVAGFVSWYVANGLYWYITFPHGLSDTYGYGILANIYPLPVNILLPIILGVIRPTRPIAMGLLAALAANFILSVLMGVAENGACLVPFFVK